MNCSAQNLTRSVLFADGALGLSGRSQGIALLFLVDQNSM
jgi:hypothetical protein